MNEFSILCRILGSLFYRQPQDPLLVPLYTAIQEGKLAQSWPLEQEELLSRLQEHTDMAAVSADYHMLFVGDECRVSPLRSSWVEGSNEAEIREFLSSRGMPLSDAPADNFGGILLAHPGLKTRLRKVSHSRCKPCLTVFCFPGAVLSLAKLKHMLQQCSGAHWPR